MAHSYVARRFDGPLLAVFPDHGERYTTWKGVFGPAATVKIVAAPHDQLFEPAVREEWLESLAHALNDGRRG